MYISASALAKLADPAGEVALARAAHASNIVYMVPTLASCPLADILGAGAPGQAFFFQLYVNSDRAVSERIVKQAEAGVTFVGVAVSCRDVIVSVRGCGVTCRRLQGVVCYS